MSATTTLEPALPITSTCPKARRDFERQVLPLMDSLYGAAMRLTRDPSDAEDLVQDSMVRAFRFWSTFRQDSNVKAWMFTILRNTFINGYNRNGRRRVFEDQLHSEMRALGDTVAVASPGVEPASQDEWLENARTKAEIREALDGIPEVYALAVEFFDLEGCTYEQIAELMDCSLGTVMSRLFRGRDLLHQPLYARALEIGAVSPDVVPGERVTPRTRNPDKYDRPRLHRRRREERDPHGEDDGIAEQSVLPLGAHV